ncbi:MAG: hypothetical protein ACREO3_06620, partial [Arenimonas sp.]
MRRLTPGATLLAVLLTGPVLAQPADRFAALETRMQALEAEAAAMRQQAEAAQAALAEARAEIDALKQAQSEAVAVEPMTQAAEAPVADAGAGASSSANAFNPALSVVLDGQVAHHSLDPAGYARSGFPLVGEGGPSAQGISLGESEMTLSASVDDKFYGQLTVAVESEDGEDGIGIEEAFVDTTALPNGLTLRVGRFFSNIGYLNSHHAHTDRFSDRPLAYQALLGNQYGDDGVQLRWVAPTDLFVELGGEVLRGQGFPAGGAGRGGAGTHTAFFHIGGDFGSESEWLVGLAAVDAQVEGGEDGFTGRNRLAIADATWKWAPQGNFKDGGVTLRGEVIVEHRDGDYVDAADPTLDQPWDGRRAGAYIEAVYRINRQWETGYRFDRLWADDDGPYASDFDPHRHSVMVSWMNSEFSLLRLQYAQDTPNPDADD